MPSNTSSLADRQFKRILLIKLSAVGDVVHTIGLLNALRRRYPTAQIDWLLKPSVAELIRPHPSVSNVLVYGENHTEAPRYNWNGVVHFLSLMRDGRFLKMLWNLRRARYDLVVDVHGQIRTAFVTMVTGAGVRIGFDRPRPEIWKAAGERLPAGTIERSWKGAREGSWMAYSHHIRLESLDLHAIDRYLRVGRLLGFDASLADCSFPIPQAAVDRAMALLGKTGVVPATAPIVIAPAALWETKRWRPESFAEVARHFISKGRPVVIIGSPDERDECRRIAAAAEGALDLSGQTTLLEAGAIIQQSAVCLTNDSGPMHMAVALGRPVVSIFGPTNPNWVGPYCQPDAVVRSGRVCSPCNLRTIARCPHNHLCMTEISAGTVIDRIEAQLAATSLPGTGA